MCLWFACLGLHKHDNDCDHAPATRGLPVYLPPPAAGATTSSPPPLRNGYHHGHGHYGNNGAQWATPLHQTAAGADEAGRKAANDVSKGPAARAAPERAFAYTGAAETMVTQTSPYYYYYHYEPAHQKEDAMDHHYAATAAATTDHERY